MTRPISEYFSDPCKGLRRSAQVLTYGMTGYMVRMFEEGHIAREHLINEGQSLDYAEDCAEKLGNKSN